MKKLLFVFAVALTCLPVVAHAVNNCTGATYYDSDTDTCIACPVGYDYNTDAGKDDITDCQIHCNAGTYVPEVVEYTQLEYIESTGTQYIDTGIKGNLNTKAVLDFQLSGYNNNGYIFGSRTAQNTNAFVIGSNSGKFVNTTFPFAQFDSVVPTFVQQAPNFDLNRHVYELSSDGFYMDGILYTSYSNPTAFSTQENITLFGRYSSGSFAYGVFRSYGLKLYEGNSLIRDFVPARNSSNVVGMYDTVSGTFFTNSGTGTFTAGADIGNKFGGRCVNVGAGYYAPASTVNYGSAGTRTACPAGTTTVGYGHGADSANDCGRTLHVGNNVLYMRKNKETSPSMGIDMGGGDVYYISLSSSNHNLSPVHLWHNGGKYTAYDDSLLYNERDLTTNTQITP